jgi:hypothetical protein
MLLSWYVGDRFERDICDIIGAELMPPLKPTAFWAMTARNVSKLSVQERALGLVKDRAQGLEDERKAAPDAYRVYVSEHSSLERTACPCSKHHWAITPLALGSTAGAQTSAELKRAVSFGDFGPNYIAPEWVFKGLPNTTGRILPKESQILV